MTISLFVATTTDNAVPITLQGLHSFNTGDESGGISASSIVGIAGFAFEFDGATDTLTLLFP